MAITDQEALERFRVEVCAKAEVIDPEERFDWTSLSIGFFAALGVVGERAEELAAKARYQEQYWNPEVVEQA